MVKVYGSIPLNLPAFAWEYYKKTGIYLGGFYMAIPPIDRGSISYLAGEALAISLPDTATPENELQLTETVVNHDGDIKTMPVDLPIAPPRPYVLTPKEKHAAAKNDTQRLDAIAEYLGWKD